MLGAWEAKRASWGGNGPLNECDLLSKPWRVLKHMLLTPWSLASVEETQINQQHRLVQAHWGALRRTANRPLHCRCVMETNKDQCSLPGLMVNHKKSDILPQHQPIKLRALKNQKPRSYSPQTDAQCLSGEWSQAPSLRTVSDCFWLRAPELSRCHREFKWIYFSGKAFQSLF